MSERSYDQYCGIARALDVVGGRWGLLVVRELILGPKRFTDLARGLPGIGTNVLSARLKQLERGGVIRRCTLPPPAASTVYELTEYGRELEGPLLAVGRWGAKSLGLRGPGQSLRSEWVAVALKAYFRPGAAEGVRATVELRLADGPYHARIADGMIAVEPGPGHHPDLVLTTDEETLIAFLAGAPVPPAALGSEGDAVLLERLPEIFAFGPGADQEATPTDSAASRR